MALAKSKNVIPEYLALKYDPPAIALFYKIGGIHKKQHMYCILLKNLINYGNPDQITYRLFQEHHLVLSEYNIDFEQVKNLVEKILEHEQQKQQQATCQDRSIESYDPLNKNIDEIEGQLDDEEDAIEEIYCNNCIAPMNINDNQQENYYQEEFMCQPAQAEFDAPYYQQQMHNQQFVHQQELIQPQQPKRTNSGKLGFLKNLSQQREQQEITSSMIGYHNNQNKDYQKQNELYQQFYEQQRDNKLYINI